MGKTGRWIKNLLTGNKKDKERVEKESKIETHHQNAANNGSDHHRPTTPVSIPQPTTPREKRRWSFRRSSATAPAGRMTDLASSDNIAGSTVTDQHAETDTKKHAMAVAVATAAAADAAVAAAKAAAAMMQLTAAAGGGGGEVEEAAAVKIQSVFRGYLARKALNALKGLVKLQALVRGHLVRKQATATLRCMQALVTVQARARAQRLRMVEEIKSVDQISHYNYNHRKSLQENRYRSPNKDFDRGLEENVKIVEMDLGDYKPVTKARNSYSNHTQEHRISTHRTSIKQENLNQISPSPSAVTDMSPRTYSNHFEDYSFGTAQSSPQCYSAMSKPDSARIPFSYPRSEYAESLYSEYSLCPNYMANTESSRAKVRSHSAPKQRPVETFERQLSRGRRPSLEGRNVPRAVKMQRSSSHVGSTAQNYQYPWSVKLDKSAVSLKDSECGSTSTVLTTNTIYCRSHVGTFDVQGARY